MPEIQLRNLSESFMRTLEKFKREKSIGTNTKALERIVASYFALQQDIEHKERQLQELRSETRDLDSKLTRLRNALSVIQNP